MLNPVRTSTIKQFKVGDVVVEEHTVVKQYTNKEVDYRIVLHDDSLYDLSETTARDIMECLRGVLDNE